MMNGCDCWPGRRSFLKGAAALGAGLSGFALAARHSEINFRRKERTVRSGCTLAQLAP